MDLAIITIQSTLPSLKTFSQQNTPNIPSDYLGSTAVSEQIRKNPFNTPTSTQLLADWITQAFTQGEPNLVSDPVDTPSDTSLSLPETLSLPSTLSTIAQTPTTAFPLNFPTKLDDRYCVVLTTNIPLVCR